MIKILLLLSVIFLSHFLVNGQDYKILSQLPVDDNFSVSTLRYKRDEFGVGLLNNKGIMSKEQTLKSSPGGLGLAGDNIVLICIDSKNYKTTGYSALLLNKKSLNVVREQSLFTKKNSNRISSTLLNDPNNNFCFALFRETKYDEGFHMLGPSGFDTKYLESSTIQLVSLNNKLEPKNIEIKTAASASFFAGASSDGYRNIYICSFTNSNITMEKFDSTGKLLAKLSSPFSVWKNPYFNFVIKNDRGDQSCVTIASICLNSDKKMAQNVIRFDFTNNKVLTAGEIILNKEYRQTLKNVNEEAKGRHFADMGSLDPVQILEDATRVILIKEIKGDQAGGKNEATTYYRDGSIITVYNKKTFEVERDIVIDKGFSTFVEPSDGIAAHLSDNYLWAVTCENSGLISFKTYVNKINLNTGEVTKTEIEKEDIGKGWVTFPKQIAWFKKNYVVPFFKVSSPISFSFESAFIVKPY